MPDIYNLNPEIKKLFLDAYEILDIKYGEREFTANDVEKGNIEIPLWFLDEMVDKNFLKSYKKKGESETFYKLKGSILNTNNSTRNKGEICV